MTISLDKPRQPPATLQRHDATWQDYEALRGDLQHIDDRSDSWMQWFMAGVDIWY
jgi:hypothetical protein